ncbi:MAG: FKBP-type peptidyl-prolyl cis-trans isomerase [Bacteroidales bacterium]
MMHLLTTRYSIRLFIIILFVGLASCQKDPNENQAIKDREKILEYLADNDLEAQEHESGLFYIIENEGVGNHPSSNSVVLISYKGYFLDEEIFDARENARMELNQTIQGWGIGIPLFKKGGNGILFIPSALGYGPYGSMGIPGNSVLIFEVELIEY